MIHIVTDREIENLISDVCDDTIKACIEVAGNVLAKFPDSPSFILVDLNRLRQSMKDKRNA